MNIDDLIQKGRSIEQGLEYVPSPKNVIRSFAVYKLDDVDDYYCWKENSIRFLHLYSPTDVDRFVKYSEDFENHHYLPRFISNMVGVLEACRAFPSEKMERTKEVQERERELLKVEELEQIYVAQSSENTIHKSESAFHAWHAAACVLFDKWFYSTDSDWAKFQSIDGDGNGYVLKHEFDMIYSCYKKLIARLIDGRNLKSVVVKKSSSSVKKVGASNKIRIFISYSHMDKKWLERLDKHLKVLARYSDPVEYWSDNKLKVGDKWREEITRAINNANVAILLVSTDFLASDFIVNDELPPLLHKAEEGGTKILPLIVSPCSFEGSEISEFQAINSPDRTLADLIGDDAAIERIYLELIKNIQELL